MSYREKSLYASLVVEVLVYGAYLFLHHQNSVNKVTGMVIAIIGLQIILQAIIAAFTRNRTTDERDRLIELRGYRAGYLALASFMILGLAALWFHTSRGDFHIDSRMVGPHFLSVFICMLVLADILKTATQIVAYRKAI